MRVKSLLIVLATLCTCGQSPSPRGASSCEASRTGALSAELNEASGITASRSNPGIFWVHNDDNPPVLYAIDSAGTVKARVRVADADNYDWEDIASGPCGQSSCLFIGDFGDNAQKRGQRIVYRIPEPSLHDTVSAPATRFTFHLPGKSHDTEAMFVMPDGRIYVITKGRSGPVTVFAFPASSAPDQNVELESIATLSRGLVQVSDMVTGASATSDGRFIAIRSYTALQLYRLSGNKLTALLPQPVDLRGLNEPQGEGIATRDDGVMFLVGENRGGRAAAPVSRVRCAGINAAPSQ
jgi:hypothetical protein